MRGAEDDADAAAAAALEKEEANEAAEFNAEVRYYHKTADYHSVCLGYSTAHQPTYSRGALAMFVCPMCNDHHDMSRIMTNVAARGSAGRERY